MALLTYNGTNFDTMLGSTAMGTGNITVSSGGITSSGVTAPNLVNKITGCWVWITSLPSSGNYLVDIMESGVQKATATINFADMKLGANYVRFATPYTFATLTGSAYTARVRHSGVGSGQISLASPSNLWFEFTYDLTVTTPAAATDNVWVAGFHDAGLTSNTLTLAGTSNAWGTGDSINIGGSSARNMGAAVIAGNGGTVAYDQTASTTLSVLGSIYTTAGGTFDMRPGSNKSVVSTLIIDSATNGQQGIVSANGATGGRFLTTGATYNIYTTYASGLGTAASPMITNIPWDADVGDEIVIGGGTDYLKNEVRYIKTRNSSTSFVLSATPGGAESALANTHAAGAHIANLQRNSIVKALVNTRGYYATNTSTTVTSDFSYTRFEYSDNTSGKSLLFDGSATATHTLDGIVIYKNSTAGRHPIQLSANNNTVTKTYTGIVLFDTQGTNFSAQSGIVIQGANNKTVNDCFQFNAPSSTLSCAFVSLGGSATANTFNNCHSYGGNAVNSAIGYVFGIFSSNGNTFNNCTVNAARQNAVYLSSEVGNTFNNCNFGNMANNTVDITNVSSSLNQAYFYNCSFNSTNLVTNYLNTLDGSLIKFQDMDGNTSKHRWYTNYGSWWSAGSGLADTTVRTAGSLSLVSKPENATTGSSWTFKIPANPTSQAGVFGYVYRNATFSSGTLKVELYLPGTLLTGTPDATYTFPATTGAWLPFNISAYYSGAVARYAQVRITGVTATSGAYFFVDDLYDAGTGNKVAGLDLWDEGQPSQIMVQSDFSVVPSAVWGYSDQNTQANTMGKRQIDASKAKLLL